jgi:hypothetical protein
MRFRSWLFLLSFLLAVMTALWLGLGLGRVQGMFLFGAFGAATLLALAFSARDRGWPLLGRTAALAMAGPVFFLPFLLIAYDQGGSGMPALLAALGTAIPVAYFAAERLATGVVALLVVFGVVLIAGRRRAG